LRGISFSSPGGGTRVSDNVVWLKSPDGGTVGEVCILLCDSVTQRSWRVCWTTQIRRFGSCDLQLYLSDSSKTLQCSVAVWKLNCLAEHTANFQYHTRGQASIRGAIRLGLYTADDPAPSQLVSDMDDNLFANVLHNCHHVLHKFLPDKTDHTYNLRSRRHSLSLTVKSPGLTVTGARGLSPPSSQLSPQLKGEWVVDWGRDKWIMKRGKWWERDPPAFSNYF